MLGEWANTFHFKAKLLTNMISRANTFHFKAKFLMNVIATVHLGSGLKANMFHFKAKLLTNMISRANTFHFKAKFFQLPMFVKNLVLIAHWSKFRVQVSMVMINLKCSLQSCTHVGQNLALK